MRPVRPPIPRFPEQNKNLHALFPAPETPAKNVPGYGTRGPRSAGLVLFSAQLPPGRCANVRAPARWSSVRVPGKLTSGRSTLAETAPAAPHQAQRARNIRCSRESEPPPELLLDPVHLTVVTFAFVIIPHQVQNAVQHQDATFVIQCPAIFLPIAR